MSFGSRSNRFSEADRAAREVAATARPTDVVMVKLKGGGPRVVAASRGVRGVASGPREPRGLLAHLLDNGRRVRGGSGVPGGRVADRLRPRGSGGADPPRCERRRRPWPRRSRGLTSLKVEAGGMPPSWRGT